MRETRRRVLELLRRRGTLTVDEMATELHLTRTAAVSQLAGLASQGLAQRAGLRTGKRRPSALYTLTKDADRLFPQEYDTLAIDLIGELKRVDARKFQGMLRRVAARWVSRDLPAIRGLKGRARVDRATAFVAERGLLPSLERAGRGFVLHQYHCPLQRVGAVYPEVCVVMERWIQALYGAPLKRLSCTSLGDSHCSYAIGRA